MPRVLIIENEESLARMLIHGLRDAGHIAEAVADSNTGLSRALSESFDLLIVDEMLPEGSGEQVVKSLRAVDIQTPVLMLASSSQMLTREGGLDLGINDYLTKPFSLHEFQARVRTFTRRTQQESSEQAIRSVWLLDNKLLLENQNLRQKLEQLEAENRAPTEQDEQLRAEVENLIQELEELRQERNTYKEQAESYADET